VPRVGGHRVDIRAAPGPIDVAGDGTGNEDKPTGRTCRRVCRIRLIFPNLLSNTEIGGLTRTEKKYDNDDW
jgi:hypothetical protein